MEQVVKALQSVVSLPLQLDSSHAEALERGLRVYNGKPIVNSVNGEAEKLNTILPLCKKYGAAVVGLAIDERGILPKAEDRVAIARRIRDAALAAGIPQEDIYIDCLTLTASAQQEDVLATVQALHACKEELGVRTILGVSNISFGLPCRSYLNTTFLTMAMYAGLDLAIMNPSSEEMMAAVYAYNVLTNRDRQSTKYIERYANRVPASAALAQAVQNAQTAPAAGETPEAAGPYAPLMKAVEKGLKGEAAAAPGAAGGKGAAGAGGRSLIPALDIVGAKYEKEPSSCRSCCRRPPPRRGLLRRSRPPLPKRARAAPARDASSLPPSRAMSTTSARTSSGSSWRIMALRSSTLAAMCRWRRWWTLSGRRMSTSWGSRP